MNTGPKPRPSECESIALELPEHATGELAEDRRRAVERHVKVCARCARELEETRAVRSLLEARPEPSVNNLARARLELRRRMQVPQRRSLAAVGRSRPAWQLALARAALFAASLAVLVTVLRSAPSGPWAAAPSGTAASTVSSWDSLRSATLTRFEAWIPELSVPELFEMLPTPEERMVPEVLDPVLPRRNG